MQRNYLKNNGFTLVEIIVYIFVVAVILVGVTYYAIDVIGAQTKARSYQEVQQNARFAIKRITQEIRAADDLNEGSSVFGTNPGTLSLVHQDPTKDPTVFAVTGGRMTITQGTSGPYYLTSDKVTVTDFTLTNLSVSERTRNIKITLTVEHVNPENRNEFEADVTVQSSAVIRVRSD